MSPSLVVSPGTRLGVALCLVLAAVPNVRAEDAFTLKPAGRLYYDVAHFSNDQRGTPESNGDDLRAAWLSIAGKGGIVDYKLEADFAGPRPVARDVYLARRIGQTTLTLGQFKQFYSLDDRASANHISTIERSWLGSTLAASYRLGVAGNGYFDGGFWGASAYSLESIDVWQIKGRGTGARGGLVPRSAAGDVLHLAASIAHERYDHPGADGAPALRVAPRIAGYFADNSRLTLVDFRTGDDVAVDKIGLEAAGVHGAWSWQAEYGAARYRDTQQQGRISAGYVQGSWMITGEAHPYDAKTGRFVQLKPQRKSGAWELVARYDTVHGRQWPLPAQTRDVSAEGWTVGVNWYAPKHLRVMLDWSDSYRRDNRSDRLLDHTRVIAGRVQLDF